MKIFDYLPEIEGDELQYINKLTESFREDQLKRFSRAYRARRKDPTLFLILTLIGLAGFAGIHRFVAGHIGLGILYFLTLGLCYIGTIIDAINYKSFAFEFNRNVARDIFDDMERF